MEVESEVREEETGVVGCCDVQGPRALDIAAPATVSGLKPDTEEAMVGHEQWSAVRARRALGQRVSVIAREMELDRKTERRCLQQGARAPYKREAPAPRAIICGLTELQGLRAPETFLLLTLNLIINLVIGLLK